MKKADQDHLKEFGECVSKNGGDIADQVKDFLMDKKIPQDANIILDAISANVQTILKLAKPIQKDLNNKKFERIGKTIGKTALKLADMGIKFRNFNKNDTFTANFVNAFDNQLISSANITLSNDVRKCYKTVEDFENMHDFLIELAESQNNFTNGTTFLNKEGKKLLKALKTVNKCKSNTKTGKALTKAAGFDVFSKFTDKIEDHQRKNPQFKFGSPMSGAQYGTLVYVLATNFGQNHHIARLFM